MVSPPVFSRKLEIISFSRISSLAGIIPIEKARGRVPSFDLPDTQKDLQMIV